MRARTKGGIVAIAVAIAIGLWWRVGLRERSPVARPSSARAHDGAPPPARPSRPRTPLGRVAMYHDEDPRGRLRLEGQVIDGDDAPMGGARVIISTNPPREARTEGDGSFAFDDLLPRVYVVEARSDALRADAVTVRVTGTTEPVILRVHPAASILVHVRDRSSGEPVAGATVDVGAAIGFGARASMSVVGATDAMGDATLRGIDPGMHRLTVAAPGYAPVSERVDATGRGSITEARIELARGVRVRGTVVDPAGAPVAGAQVVVEDVTEPFPVTDRTREVAVTDAEGAWELAAVRSGTFRFVAHHAPHARGASAPVVVDGTHDRAGVAIRLAAGRVLSGRVVRVGGERVAGAQVRVVVTNGGFAWRGARTTHTGGDGRFTLAGLPAAAVDVVAVGEAGASRRQVVDLAGPSPAPVTLVLDVVDTIAGVVVSPSGEPVPEARVLADPVGADTLDDQREWRLRGPQRDVADAGGTFRFSGLPPGSYRLRAVEAGAPDARLTLQRGTIVEVGAQDVRLVIAGRGRVRGRVQLADGTAPRLIAVSVGAAPARMFSAGDGRFEVAAAAGTHNLVVSGPSFVRLLVPRVRVVEGETHDLGTITVAPGRSISGRVVTEQGVPVAGAQVALGAQLTGTGSQLVVLSESRHAQVTTTDADGQFVFDAVGPRALVVVAQGPQARRSRSVPIAAGARSAAVELVVGATGGLAGQVLRGGAPVASAAVLASPRAAPASIFFVMTGPDGSFRLEHLAPQEYLVTAMIGGGGPRPKDMISTLASVTAGEVTRVDVPIEDGPVNLAVTVRTAGGEVVQTARVALASGHIEATRVGEMFTALAERGEGIAQIRMIMAGRAATFTGLRPGAYTLCATPIDEDMTDPAVVQRLAETMQARPLQCMPHEVARQPAQQTHVMVVAGEG